MCSVTYTYTADNITAGPQKAKLGGRADICTRGSWIHTFVVNELLKTTMEIGEFPPRCRTHATAVLRMHFHAKTTVMKATHLASEYCGIGLVCCCWH